MGYGLFRFLHEFRRDTPRFLHDDGALTGYQYIALGVFAFGAWMFWQRRAEGERRQADGPAWNAEF